MNKGEKGMTRRSENQKKRSVKTFAEEKTRGNIIRATRKSSKRMDIFMTKVLSRFALERESAAAGRS